MTEEHMRCGVKLVELELRIEDLSRLLKNVAQILESSSERMGNVKTSIKRIETAMLELVAFTKTCHGVCRQHTSQVYHAYSTTKFSALLNEALWVNSESESTVPKTE